MNAITGVTVNGTSYTKGDLGWGASGTLWNVGSATGAYGSYTALKIVNPDSYPATLEITAEGYNTITVNVEKNVSVYPYTYTATVKTPEVEPSTPPQRSRKRIRMHQPILRYRHPSAMTLT